MYDTAVYHLGDDNSQHKVANVSIVAFVWLLPLVYGIVKLMFRVRWRVLLFIVSGLMLFMLPVAASDEIRMVYPFRECSRWYQRSAVWAW